MENTSTRTLKSRATMKCPHSWIRMMTPSTRATPMMMSDISWATSRNSLRRPVLPNGLGRCHGFARQPADFLSRYSPRFGVGREHVVHSFELYANRACQHTLDHFRNTQERDLALEECRDCHFIRGVQSAGPGSSLFHRLSGQAQAGIPPRRHLLKIQTLQLGPVQVYLIRCHPLRIG